MIRNKLVYLGLLAGAMAISGANIARADELQDIKSSGVLVVGVKTDYPPFGYLSPTGANIGIEPDLARNLAQQLGVKVQFIPVTAANRILLLLQGKINLLIATMNDTSEREKIVDIIHPDYYASGYNVMVPKTSKLTDWAQLKGVPICAMEGSFYNKEVIEKYDPALVAFNDVAKALTALQQGHCNAFLYDNTAIEGELMNPTWKAGYDMPLPTQDEQPWGMAIRSAEPALAAVISKASEDWMQTGYILSLETQYGIPHSAYVVQQHDKYKS